MADALRVSDEGLQVLAAHCETVSAELVAAAPLPRVGLPIQATSGVVGAAHAALGGVIAVLSRRAQTSAVKSAVAGAEFAANDTDGAQQAADLVQVRGLADVLHKSSAIARRGAETLDSAKRSVLDAVEEASSAGYLVGEDLSVMPPRAGVAPAAQAQLYAADIEQRAAQLVSYDKEIAAKARYRKMCETHWNRSMRENGPGRPKPRARRVEVPFETHRPENRRPCRPLTRLANRLPIQSGMSTRGTQI